MFHVNPAAYCKKAIFAQVQIPSEIPPHLLAVSANQRARSILTMRFYRKYFQNHYNCCTSLNGIILYEPTKIDLKPNSCCSVAQLIRKLPQHIPQRLRVQIMLKLDFYFWFLFCNIYIHCTHNRNESLKRSLVKNVVHTKHKLQQV